MSLLFLGTLDVLIKIYLNIYSRKKETQLIFAIIILRHHATEFGTKNISVQYSIVGLAKANQLL